MSRAEPNRDEPVGTGVPVLSAVGVDDERHRRQSGVVQRLQQRRDPLRVRAVDAGGGQAGRPLLPHRRHGVGQRLAVARVTPVLSHVAPKQPSFAEEMLMKKLDGYWLDPIDRRTVS